MTYPQKIYFCVLFIDNGVWYVVNEIVLYLMCSLTTTKRKSDFDSPIDEQIKLKNRIKQLKEPGCNNEIVKKVSSILSKYKKNEMKKQNGCPFKKVAKCNKSPCVTECKADYGGIFSSKKYCNINLNGETKRVSCFKK